MVESSHNAGFWPSVYEPFRTIGSRIADWFSPASEASSDKKRYKVVLELPGVSADDIDVSMQNNTLVIKGEKYSKKEEKEGSYFFSERQYGAFQRSFSLPPDAMNDQVEASFKDGVLEVTIARETKEPAAKNKISIST